MIAPSSPVPAVERIELPGGWYFQQLNPPHGVLYALRTPKGQGFGVNGTGMSVGRPVVEAFVAAMSSPTPGRAAEPDTMGEVERLFNFLNWHRNEWEAACKNGPSSKAIETRGRVEKARDDLFAYVRTIVTERDAALADLDTVSHQAMRDQVALQEVEVRAETAEARVAILEQPPCGGCGAKVTEPCRRDSDYTCFREFHGGSRTALLFNPKADR